VGFKAVNDHYLDSLRYAFGMRHYRRVKRPSWLHPIKRVLWVHHHGPHVPFIRVEIPSFGKLGKLNNLT
jgi:hypothetical protein